MFVMLHNIIADRQVSVVSYKYKNRFCDQTNSYYQNEKHIFIADRGHIFLNFIPNVLPRVICVPILENDVLQV